MTDSAAQVPTKFKEWAEQGTYFAHGLIVLVLDCIPEYKPDILLALSYD